MRDILFRLIALTPVDTHNLPGASQNNATPASLHTILAIVFGIVGALALLMITISGLRYVLSGGDPQKTAKAKDGIIYALVGLVIAVSAETIVMFVLDKTQ